MYLNIFFLQILIFYKIKKKYYLKLFFYYLKDIFNKNIQKNILMKQLNFKKNFKFNNYQLFFLTILLRMKIKLIILLLLIYVID